MKFLATAAILLAIVSGAVLFYVVSGKVGSKETLYVVGQFVCSTLDDSNSRYIKLKDCSPMQGTAQGNIELINPTNVLKISE